MPGSWCAVPHETSPPPDVDDRAPPRHDLDDGLGRDPSSRALEHAGSDWKISSLHDRRTLPRFTTSAGFHHDPAEPVSCAHGRRSGCTAATFDSTLSTATPEGAIATTMPVAENDNLLIVVLPGLRKPLYPDRRATRDYEFRCTPLTITWPGTRKTSMIVSLRATRSCPLVDTGCEELVDWWIQIHLLSLPQCIFGV